MSDVTSETGNRRDFLGQLASAGVVLAAGGACATSGSHPTGATLTPVGGGAPEPGKDPEKDNSWDMTWLTRITGRHKQVYDISVLGEGQGLRTIRNYLNAYRDVFHLNPPDVTAVAGMVNAGHINFTDAIWAKYGFGEETKTKDLHSDAWVTRNVFRHADAGEAMVDYSLEALQARGVIFWQCNNALKGITRRLATKMQMAPEAVRAELIAGMLPGVVLVPAHTMAIGLAQEHGCTYEAIA
jgi:hypothetical protein